MVARPHPAAAAATSPSFAEPSDEVTLASRHAPGGLMETDLAIPTARCAGCIRSIEGALSGLDGVVQARVNLSTRRVTVKWRHSETPPPLVSTLAKAGYEATLSSDPADDRDKEMSRLVWATAIAGFGMMNIMLLSASIWSGADPKLRDAFHGLSAILAAPVVVYSGRIFFSSAWAALKTGRTNMDVPIAIGILLTFGLSLYDTFQRGPHAYFDAATSLIFVLLVGRTLDHMMRRKARTAVLGLAKLMPRGATVVAGGKTTYTATEAIREGEIVRVAPGDRIPLDGIIVSGEADIDAAIVNGEAGPTRMAVGSAVLSGMLSINGRIDIRVSRNMQASFIATMISMMEAAEHGRARYRRFADRAAAMYAPVVHTLAAASFAGWVVATGNWHHSLTVAVSVLIITCPCALGLAVPMVHVMAARRLFELNIALKDGSALERLAETDVVVFDKTGTLTLGKLEITKHSLSQVDFDAAIALGACSRHPVSQAVAALGHPNLSEDVESVSEHPGLGVAGRIGGHDYRLGRIGWAQGQDDAGEGVAFSRDGTVIGEFSFTDTLRPDAQTAIEAIRSRGIAVEILSGDTRTNVAAIAHRVGVRDFRHGLMPRDKVARLEELRQRGYKTVMVGDGLNDTPALSAAHVSMAPGGAADVGRSAADLVFLLGNLKAIPDAIEVAVHARRLVLQNVALAVVYNVVVVPVAVAGMVTPLLAAIAMSASSILVVANSIRLSAPLPRLALGLRASPGRLRDRVMP
ncbi:MAG: cadmium-translocating P-type ATPase [Alphaproteobacteria bacterium]|nr:MAG: cadmium-translocating P-type ATPase [Alphaproteobacteria bacterium]